MFPPSTSFNFDALKSIGPIQYGSGKKLIFFLFVGWKDKNISG